MPVPCGFDVAPESASATPTANNWAAVGRERETPIGVWVMTLRINESSYVTTADVPYYNRELPLSGCKPAREALLDSIRSANGGLTD